MTKPGSSPSSHRVRRLPICLILAAGSAWAVPTFAASPAMGSTQTSTTSTFDQLLDSGLEAYDRGAYRRAARLFLQAHALRPEPELIFNAARSSEKGLDREQAVALYERFVRLPGTTADLRARALDSLAQLRRELQALERQKTLPAPSGPLPMPRPTLGDEGTVGRATAEPVPDRVRRTPEIILLGVGTAAAAAGAVLGGLALDARSSFDDATGASRAELAEKAEDRALAADILWATAATGVATGVLMWLVRKN